MSPLALHRLHPAWRQSGAAWSCRQITVLRHHQAGPGCRKPFISVTRVKTRTAGVRFTEGWTREEGDLLSSGGKKNEWMVWFGYSSQLNGKNNVFKVLRIPTSSTGILSRCTVGVQFNSLNKINRCTPGCITWCDSRLVSYLHASSPSYCPSHSTTPSL